MAQERSRKIKTLGRANRLIRRPAYRSDNNREATELWPMVFKMAPILISSLALIISYWSWKESHQGRMINEEINRPVLSIVNIKGTMGGIHIQADTKVITLIVKIKNIGKSTAKVEQAEVKVRLLNETDSCKMLASRVLDILDKDLNSNAEVLPGSEGDFLGHALVPVSCLEKQALQFRISITPQYYETVSIKQFYQIMSEDIVLYLDDLKENENEMINGPKPKDKGAKSINASPAKTLTISHIADHFRIKLLIFFTGPQLLSSSSLLTGFGV